MNLTTPHSSRIHRACPVCGCRASESIYDNRLAPLGGLDLSYVVARCSTCGFHYAETLADEATYIDYYRRLSKYDYADSSRAISTIDSFRARSVVSFCRPHITDNTVIADLGCGIGHQLHAFKEAGWQTLYGIDPAPRASQRAREAFGLNSISSGRLDEAANLLPLDHIGLVCLTGVLEHLGTPREDMAQLISHLKPGSLILIEVPALEYFAKAPNEPFGEFSLEHVQYFSADTLNRFFATLGASTVKTGFLKLPPGVTDSLLGLYRVAPYPLEAPFMGRASDHEAMEAYFTSSSNRFLDMLERICHHDDSPWVIYGAGSHTARLLPALEALGHSGRIIGIVDGNENLHGCMLGHWRIEAPSALTRWPEATVIISSFRAQPSILSTLRGHISNSIICLYPNDIQQLC